ncbi:MAG: helix-turn-helix domain-containing protein, partial [Myxococcota bacterium]
MRHRSSSESTVAPTASGGPEPWASATPDPIRAEIPLIDGRIDLDDGVVFRSGVAQPLTPIERRLIRYLAARPGRICARDQLLVEVWGYRPGVRSRTIDNTLHRLREKIERDPADPVHLQAVYGRGIRLELAPLPLAGQTGPERSGEPAPSGRAGKPAPSGRAGKDGPSGS